MSVRLRQMPRVMETAELNYATAATHQVIAAPGAGYKIIPWGLFYTLPSAADVTLKSGSTSLHGGALRTSARNSPPPQPGEKNRAYPMYECNENEAFSITLGSAVQMSGTLYYEIVTV